MKLYASFALFLSVVVLLWSTLALADIGKFRLDEAVPYLLIYAFGMLAFSTAAFLYVRKMERRRLTRRRW